MEGWDKKNLRRVHGTPVHVIVYIVGVQKCE